VQNDGFERKGNLAASNSKRLKRSKLGCKNGGKGLCLSRKERLLEKGGALRFSPRRRIAPGRPHSTGVLRKTGRYHLPEVSSKTTPRVVMGKALYSGRYLKQARFRETRGNPEQFLLFGNKGKTLLLGTHEVSPIAHYRKPIAHIKYDLEMQEKKMLVIEPDDVTADGDMGFLINHNDQRTYAPL